MKESCENCYFWGRLFPSNISRNGGSYGPWPNEKPAKSCMRFPPNTLWGSDNTAKAYGVGEHVKTWYDDWCGEYKSFEIYEELK